MWTFFPICDLFDFLMKTNRTFSSRASFSLRQKDKRRLSRRRRRSDTLVASMDVAFKRHIYPSKQKCWETWETFIFNAAFPNLITSAIRLQWHENELAEGNAGVVTCSVCLGQPKDGEKKLLRVGIKFHQFFRLWQVCGQCLCPCQ